MFVFLKSAVVPCFFSEFDIEIVFDSIPYASSHEIYISVLSSEGSSIFKV